MIEAARGTALSRRIRSSGGRTLRRLGLLPQGQADDLGDDDQLLGQKLHATAIVFFPGTEETIGDLTRWYRDLRQLHAVHPVLIVLKDSRVAARVKESSALPAVTVAHYGTLDDTLGRSDVKMALYVNHHPWNFSMLRFTSLVHVSLLDFSQPACSGPLDTNQVKAYDFLLTSRSDKLRNLTARSKAPDRSRAIRMAGEKFSETEGGAVSLLEVSAMILEARERQWARVQANGAVGP